MRKYAILLRHDLSLNVVKLYFCI